MSYLKLPRAQRAVFLFLASSLLFAWFPDIDLRLSGLFYRNGGFHLADRWWAALLQDCVGYFICIALATVLGISAFNRVAKRNVGGVDGKVVGYLFVVLVLGAGLIVNVVLKNNFGRARPRSITQFGGMQQFTPAFVVTGECVTNCSFSSGDSAGAFFALALAAVVSRRRATLVAAAVGFGTLVSFARIASGAHFLSDTAVSFFVMWITADVASFYMLVPRSRVAQPEPAPLRGYQGIPVPEVPGFGAVAQHVNVRAEVRSHGAR